MLKYFYLLFVSFLPICVVAGATCNDDLLEKGDPHQVNVFVISKTHRKTPDVTTAYIRLRATINAIHAPNHFLLIIARNADEAAHKIERHFQRRKGKIASLWFDSHGHYGDRYASFSIGETKFFYQNITDSNYTNALRSIGRFCDNNTKIALGACYAGAGYDFPATDSNNPVNMQGDSLLKGLGQIFSASIIYASESWVMAKPGMFTHKYGFAGNPIQKRFRDKIYEPVWEHLGSWKMYAASTGELKNIPTLAITRWGKIKINKKDYNQLGRIQRRINRKKIYLQAGLAQIK